MGLASIFNFGGVQLFDFSFPRLSLWCCVLSAVVPSAVRELMGFCLFMVTLGLGWAGTLGLWAFPRARLLPWSLDLWFAGKECTLCSCFLSRPHSFLCGSRCSWPSLLVVPRHTWVSRCLLTSLCSRCSFLNEFSFSVCVFFLFTEREREGVCLRMHDIKAHHVPQHVFGAQRNICLSPSTMCISGIELMLAASAFTHRAISPALVFSFYIWCLF